MEGHYSTSCTRPVVSRAQRKANRRAFDELQGSPRQYSTGPGPGSSVPSAQVASAAIVSNGGERQEQGGRRMNNVVIVKRPTIEEAEDNDKNYTYSVTTATQSQKKKP